MAAIIKPSQGNGLAEGKDANIRHGTDSDRLCMCACAFGCLWKKTSRS